MLKIISPVLAGTILAAAIATAAWANASDDGNAGVEALNSGAYDQAIRLFTRALKSGELAGDDKEFAYFNRGKAYIGKGEFKLAVADLKAALKLKPDDSDAQAALDDAQSSADGGGGGTHVAAGPVGTGWGFLGDLAGRYFWYEAPGKDPHLAIVRYQWGTPQQTLNYVIRTKTDTAVAGQYKLDPATNKVVEAEATLNATVYGTVTASRNGLTEYLFNAGTPNRQTGTRQPDGSIAIKSQTYVNGAWQDGASVTLVEVPEADAESQGFFKHKKS
jgi:tetratricopeptide (TPR) repeat protein